MRSEFTAVALAVLCMHAGQVRAAPVTLAFAGKVDSVIVDPDPGDGGISDIGFGTPFLGTYTFESTTPDVVASSLVGSYSMSGGAFAMQVEFGGAFFSTLADDSLNVSVVNAAGGSADQYTVLAREGAPDGLGDRLSIEIQLDDPTGMALDGDGLPLTAPDANQYAIRRFFLHGVQTVAGTTFQYQVLGQVDVLADDLTDSDGDVVPDVLDNCLLVANGDQRDSNGDGFGNVCDTDLNGDNVTNAVDLGLFKSVFFTGGADADFNGDGIVNSIDLGFMKTFFFLPPGPSGLVP